MAYTAKDLNPLVRGDDWTIKLNITSNNQPLDVTNYVFYFTLKDNIDDPDPGNIQVSVSPTGQDALDGLVYISVNKTATQNLEAKTYNYDVQQIDDTGSVQTLLIGKVKVVKDVTRSTP
jgi:hypothetical protein